MNHNSIFNLIPIVTGIRIYYLEFLQTGCKGAYFLIKYNIFLKKFKNEMIMKL